MFEFLNGVVDPSCWDYWHFSVEFTVSADKDVEVCETAEAEIADLKMQMAALEDDVSH